MAASIIGKFLVPSRFPVSVISMYSTKRCLQFTRFNSGSAEEAADWLKYKDMEEEMADDRFQPFSADKDVKTYKKGSFADLFRNSNFARTKNPVDKEVEGVIIAMKEDKMYVDFGAKFHAVVDLPRDSFGYFVGAKVLVLVQELEAVGHFIGDPKHNSLLEAQVRLKSLL